MESFEDHSILPFSECSYRWMGSTFSAGGFKSLSKKHPTQTESETTEKPEVSKTHKVIAGDETAAFACAQDGCVRVFQRYSALEKHLTSEKCTKSLEKRSLLDLAKIAYKSAFLKKVWGLYQLYNQFQDVNVELIAVIRKAGLLSQPKRPTGLVRTREHTLMPNSILAKPQVEN